MKEPEASKCLRCIYACRGTFTIASMGALLKARVANQEEASTDPGLGTLGTLV